MTACPYELAGGVCRWLRDWHPRQPNRCDLDACPASTGPWGAWRAGA